MLVYLLGMNILDLKGMNFMNDDINKIESYRRVINKINSISKNDIKKIWIENKDKIQSNVNIISDLINFRIVNQDKGIHTKYTFLKYQYILI